MDVNHYGNMPGTRDSQLVVGHIGTKVMAAATTDATGRGTAVVSVASVEGPRNGLFHLEFGHFGLVPPAWWPAGLGAATSSRWPG